MEVVDTQKLETAVIYLQRITEGRNPVTNMPAEEDSVINNPNVVRCMFFIKDILEELRKNDGYIGRRPRTNRDNNKLDVPVENLSSFKYTGVKSLTKLVTQINELYDIGKYKKVTYEPIKSWLIMNDYLHEIFDNEYNKKVIVPTKKGIELGINSERRTDSRGIKFIYVTYNQLAQEYIVQNMDKILLGQ